MEKPLVPATRVECERTHVSTSTNSWGYVDSAAREVERLSASRSASYLLLTTLYEQGWSRKGAGAEAEGF